MNTVDMGQGSDTAMAQIVAEVLDLRAEDVRVLNPDTDVTPYDMGTLGSRSTFHMGLAVKRAAEDARDKLKALAAEVGLPPGSNIPVAEIVPEALRHAGRQRDRLGHRSCRATSRPIRNPACRRT